MIPDTLRDALAHLVAQRLGADWSLAEIHESDGHAGLTFLFDVQGPLDAQRRYVLKLPPAGVARRGNTDVYRQAPLLRALRGADLPVPGVPWAEPDEDTPFKLPYIVMECLPGRTLFVWDPHPSYVRTPEVIGPLWRQAVEALPHFHRFDWRTRLAGWQAPEPLAEQVTRWRRIYQQAPEPRWIAQAEAVEALLLAHLPEGSPVGLYHGDYQPGNILYADGRLTGIIDWEISGIGDVLLDIGWLMMAADQHNWVDQWHAICPPPVDELRDVYEAGMRERFPAIPWYQAFAGFRLGSIGCLNVKLHRKGQRHDPIWESIGLCLSNMFERAREILMSHQT